MGKLLESFEKQMAKNLKGKIANTSGTVMYSTGFQNLDYLNAYWCHVNGNGKDYKYLLKGVPDGKTIEIIGRSGTGKTTLAIQMAANIIRPFANGLIIHDDLEAATNDTRYEILTRFTEGELKNKYKHRDSGITVESFYKQFKEIHDIKIANNNEFIYNTGFEDIYGNPIFKLEPTVYILDSIPMLMPEDVLVDDGLGTNMTGASVTKSITTVLKRVVQMGIEANIILISINHIMDDVQIGPFQKKPKISGLKPGERLPGGTVNGYLANTMFRVDDGTKLKPEESFGIDGFIGSVQTIKSRASGSLKTVPLLFSKHTGWNNELSLFQLLKKADKVHGAGSYLYLGSRDDIKFSQRNFTSILSESPDLQVALVKEAYPLLNEIVDSYQEEATTSVSTTSINDLMDKMSRGELVDIPKSEETATAEPKKKSKKSDNPLEALGDLHEISSANIEDETTE
jgi:energy-coupling factor transporter ATP-binding protein EcfA2